MREFLTILFFSCTVINMLAQSDTSYIEINSKMRFTSEINHDLVMMDEEGNQFDHYDNFIVVDYESKKLKIPYYHNYIFWDEYDENLNLKKRTYKIIVQMVQSISSHLTKTKYSLYKVYDSKQMIYDASQKNPFMKN